MSVSRHYKPTFHHYWWPQWAPPLNLLQRKALQCRAEEEVWGGWYALPIQPERCYLASCPQYMKARRWEVTFGLWNTAKSILRAFNDLPVMIVEICGILGVHCSYQTPSLEWNKGAKARELSLNFPTQLFNTDAMSGFPHQRMQHSSLKFYWNSWNVLFFLRSSIWNFKILTPAQRWERSVSSTEIVALLMAVSKLSSGFSVSNCVQSTFYTHSSSWCTCWVQLEAAVGKKLCSVKI